MTRCPLQEQRLNVAVHRLAACLLPNAASLLALLEAHLELVGQPVLLCLVSDLRQGASTIERRAKANMSPGNSLFLGMSFTSWMRSRILTICAILRLKERRAPGALGRGIAKS